MSGPPTGTVTFLFTDIEGSTRLWERNPEAMQASLSRHDETLRGAIEKHDGHVFKTVGDAFCAAFSTATDALEAALLAQRTLYSEPWKEGRAIRVSMALHTGAVEERGGDYFGPPVNRVARLLSAGHGGQTLLSFATQELVRDGLPPI
jgi:class 3 adenylate cyclase